MLCWLWACTLNWTDDGESFLQDWTQTTKSIQTDHSDDG